TANAFVGLPASGEDGLEIARMVSDGTHGFMGIGDFFTENDEPTETLDVKGNARIRQVPQGDFDRALVIDGDGVLHWRDFESGGPGTSLGNDCELDLGDPGFNPLPIDTDWEIPLNDNNFVFSGQGTFGTNSVGIGIDGCTPTAKLDVLMNPEEINCITIKGVNEGFLAANGVSIGIYGDASNSHSSIGVCGVASNSHISTGVYGIATSSTSDKNNGGYFTAGDAINNYGGYFETFSSNPNTINNYGVYAVCPHEVTGAPGNWAGYFEGNVNVEGSITATDYLSDQQFKQDIVDYNGALVKIRELRPVNFYFDTVNYYLNFPTVMQYGLIAQEVETVFPELVSDEIIPAKFDSVGNIVSESIPYKGLNYQQLTPIILQAVKELDETITVFMQTIETPQFKGSIEDLQYINDSLTQRLNSLEARLENIEQILFYNGDITLNNIKESTFQQEVTLENTKSIVLNQNVPNPFKEHTTISYQIPETVKEAKIVFIDNLGNILKQVEIQERGNGELLVYAYDLSAGNYTYYLVADGITIDSKKMVLTK
ncbi:MAG: tail fiber domain-containing protein, partial [Bacteroidales bacterium]|nr:tail fiber domain-containing protein [Bacteroidales bacterium]